MTYPPPHQPPHGSQPTGPVPPPSSSPPTTPYPTYLGQPTPPPQRPRSNAPILGVVIALAVLLVGGTVATGVLLVNRGEDPGTVTTDPTRGAETPQPEQTTPETEPTDDDYGSGRGNGAKVVYEVTGDGPANIVYFGKDGITPESDGASDLPWRKELTLESDAAFVSVTATRGGGNGNIQCRITIDGKEVAKKSSDGPIASVLCSKLVL